MSRLPGGANLKRRRDAEATRAAILAAATRQFACQGYERVGVREIAAEAGVTAALVNRYFGSKEGLFVQVVENTFDLRELIEGDRATLAERLARVMVYGREETPQDSPRIPVLLLMRSVTEPCTAAAIRANLERGDLRRLSEVIGGPDATLRAAMVIAQITGFVLMDQVLAPATVATAPRERVMALLTEALAACMG